MNYAGGIWAGLRSDRPVPDLIGPGGALPLILSVVVYGGRRRWTAPRELRDILASAPEGLLGSRPQHRYLPIDLQRLDPASMAKNSVLAMIAELERARAPEQVAKVARSVIEWADRGAEPELRDRLGEWISQVLVTLHGREGRKLELILRKHEEARMSLLLERARKWGEELDQRLEKGMEKGLQKGRVEGREQGRLEGERALVRRLVARRFGEEAAEDFVPVLAGISDSDRLTAIATAVFACESAAELVRWARGGESAG